ncbi:MAG: hypothetical protein QN162_11890 [Armatimonadota bacterium]|nr:hypothetical protein [Armatimonadota bacterium]
MDEVRYTESGTLGWETVVRDATAGGLAALMLALLAPGLVAPPPLVATPAPALTLDGVAHGLEARALVVTGAVRNRGPEPVRGVAVDVTGLSPSGAPAFFGSDGIPWPLPPGTTARFTVRLPLAAGVVREYAVEVWLAGVRRDVLARTRRQVEPLLYLPVLPAMVRVDGAVTGDTLVVRSHATDLPVTHVVVDATVSLPGLPVNSLERFVLHVPANDRAVLRLGTRGAFLVALRVVDVWVQRAWTE